MLKLWKLFYPVVEPRVKNMQMQMQNNRLLFPGKGLEH